MHVMGLHCFGTSLYEVDGTKGACMFYLFLGLASMCAVVIVGCR